MARSLQKDLKRRNLAAMELSFLATQALAIIPGAVLPKGARPVMIQTLGGATGGASPTVDIGTMADGAFIHNELDADTPGGPIIPNGTNGTTPMAAPTQLAGRAGASAAAGGTHTCVLYYVIDRTPPGGQ